MTRKHDLPTKWDGVAVTWESWDSNSIHICPPPPEHDKACEACGAIGDKNTAIGRTTFRKLLIASRCGHCSHDTVYDITEDHLWSLDVSDYTDEGSYATTEPYTSCQVCTFGYCAPNRCYCGHPACNAYDSYINPYTQPFPDIPHEVTP